MVVTAMAVETSSIAVGQQAPDFELTSTRGQRVRLGELYLEQRVLLLFYPRNLAGG